MFAGIFSKRQALTAWGDSAQILAALAPMRLGAPSNSWKSERHMLLQIATRNGAASAEIYHQIQDSIAVVFWGRLDNRQDLILKLQVTHNAKDDELIALAWLKWGRHCPEHLIGDYSFAIMNYKNGAVFLACDVIGVKPLFYRIDEQGIFFASSAAAFKALKIGTLTRSKKWMAEYLLDLSHSHTDTAYKEIKKLPGAHSLLMHSDGKVEIRRYHQFIDDAPVEKEIDMAWLQAYKSRLQEAVSCRMPANETIGTENSGGLDSGSITAELARQLGPRIAQLYGMGFCRQKLEPEYIMATAMKYKMKHNYLVSNNSESQWTDVRRSEHLIHGYPQEHPDGSFHVPFYEICLQQNIAVLYSGFGGDEVVTSTGVLPACYEMLDQRCFQGLWSVLPGSILRRAIRFMKIVLRKKATPKIPNDVLMQRWQYQFLCTDIINDYDLESRYITACNYNSGFRSVNQVALNMLSRSCTSSRLHACTLVAANYGIDYVWPLLDQRLIKQWLSTPTIWKVKDGVDRYLHRMAVADTSAEIVTWKPTKDMGYAPLVAAAAATSNAPLLNRLNELTTILPSELLQVIDVDKIREIVSSGLSIDCRGANIHFTLEDYVYRLENLVAWLNSEQ